MYMNEKFRVKEYLKKSNRSKNIRREVIIMKPSRNNFKTLKQELAKEKNNVNIIYRIQNIVCSVTEISYEEIKGKKRLKEIVFARHMMFYFTRKYTNMTYKQIALEFNRDHATVMHGVKAINDYLEMGIYNAEIINKVDDLIKRI